jgi:succinyl-diaminopimelate desuccinylase
MPDILRDELVRLTCDMIRFQSTADRPDQLHAVVDYLDHYLSAVPDIFVQRSTSNGKPAIVATLHDTRTPALLLNGHVDVVMGQPAQFDPQIRDGRIYGRGSQDMKGSVAVLLRLLKDLAARDTRPDVGFQFVSDEEIGGAHGTERLFNEGWRCDYFIAAEPTDMDICNEHKGALWVELRLPGMSAHGSRPWEGRNPILALHRGLDTLFGHFPPLEQATWRTTITPTAIQAGIGSPNQVPPELQLTLDVRHIPADQPDDILAVVHTCFPEAEEIKCRRAAPLATSPENAHVRRLAAISTRIRNQETRFYSEHFSTDARFYSAAGIPAVCFGPVGAGLHSPEEWVVIDSLVQMYDVLHTMILE